MGSRGRSALCFMGAVLLFIGLLFGTVGAVQTDLETFLLPGAILMLCGAVCLTLDIRRRKKGTGLKDAGYFIWAEVTDCVPNSMVRINGRMSYVLYARDNHSGRMYTSHLLYSLSRPQLRGRQVRIYLDRENPACYYMDTAELFDE